MFANIFVGILFVVIGFYLPKCKMNPTVGIKVPWAYSSDENWNNTHRFGGKVWVICGFLMIAAVFLPADISAIAMVILIFVMVLLPTIYSYLFYKKEMQEGKTSRSKMSEEMRVSKRVGKITGIFIIVTVAFVAVLMYTGNIDFSCEEAALVIEADYWGDMTIDYEQMESVKYLENDEKGSRTGGYGSARLLMGTFRNDKYDYYTRYSYTKCDAGIELNLGKKVVVISGIDEESTQKLYEEIVEAMR